MLRDVRIRSAQELMTAEASDQLTRVSQALASGGYAFSVAPDTLPKSRSDYSECFDK